MIKICKINNITEENNYQKINKPIKQPQDTQEPQKNAELANIYYKPISFGSKSPVLELKRILAQSEKSITGITTIRDAVSDPKDALFVNMGHYAISRLGHGFDNLKTSSINNCVGLTLYDPATKTGFLSHIAGGNPEVIKNSFREILVKLHNLGVDVSNLEARIIGGENHHSESGKIIGNIEELLERYRIKLSEKDVMGDKTRNIVLNLDNGSVSSYKPEFKPENELEHVHNSMVILGEKRLRKEKLSPQIPHVRNESNPILSETDRLQQEFLKSIGKSGE